MILNSRLFKTIGISSVLFTIFISTLYVDYKKEEIQSFFIGDLSKEQLMIVRSVQTEYNSTYYSLILLPEQKEFLKEGMQKALPNEVAYCLYGSIVNNTINVNNMHDGTLSSTPISARYNCEVNGDFLFAIHSHPNSFENWECYPSDKDLYSIADNSLKLNGIICFDDAPELFLTDINRELMDVLEI